MRIPVIAASAPFRDTLTYRPEKASWTIEIEAFQSGGTRKHFARYEIHRNQLHANHAFID